jgi:ribonuclease HI
VTTWHIHCDGTALPNPGRIGIGVVLVAPDGSRHELSEAPGLNGCNNEAEALALLAALKRAEALEARVLCIRCDSVVLVEQTTGTARTKIARLAKLFEECRTLLAVFDSIDFRWTSRHLNQEADTLARKALGLAAKVPKKRSNAARIKRKH